MNGRILSRLFMLFSLLFLWTVQGAMGQGTISLPWTGQDKCYNTSGTQISCAGTRQDGDLQIGVDWPDPQFTVNGECVTDNTDPF